MEVPAQPLQKKSVGSGSPGWLAWAPPRHEPSFWMEPTSRVQPWVGMSFTMDV